MIKFLQLLVAFLPVAGIAQSHNLTGFWSLKNRESLSGPNYSNGIPKLVKVEHSSNLITIEVTNQVGEKDTTEKEIFRIGDSTTVSFTPTQRKKITRFFWDNRKAAWIKHTSLSAKNDFAKDEISIIETFKLAPTGNELIVTKAYDGTDAVGGNLDFSMKGVFEKTTAEQLAWETATGNGVQFVEGLTWQQILDKAQTGNKFIFVDCYATWCLPCKRMDKEVYPLNMVGKVLNETFIAVKVQMDTAKTDNAIVSMTYPIARKLENDYKVTALPTYLFFDASGNIVHKDIGAFNGKDFVQLVKTALDTSAQIYTQAKKALTGQIPPFAMASLAYQLREDKYSEKVLAKQIARKYLEDYLYKLDENEFYTHENIKFLRTFLSVVKSSDPVIKSIIQEPKKADSLLSLGEGAGRRIVEIVISNEYIQPHLKTSRKKNKNPDWQNIETNIKKKFSKEYATQATVNAKVSWYNERKDWKPYCKYLVMQIEQLGNLDYAQWFQLNIAAWAIFQHSSDKAQLEKALLWSQASIENLMKDSTMKKDQQLPGFIAQFRDTYANILYKLGRTAEALKYYEDKIISVEPNRSDFIRTFTKMKLGHPTWPVE